MAVNYIETTDYNGNKIICTRNQWYGHVINNHGIMARNKDVVVETLKTPDEVYEDALYENRNLYFKTDSRATYGTKFLTKVVVEFGENTAGEIITAYPTNTKGSVGDVVYKPHG